MDKVKLLKGIGIGATVVGTLITLIGDFVGTIYQDVEINQKIDEGLDWRFDELAKMIRGEDD